MRLKCLQKSGKKKLTIIPFLMTFANACLGLLSILYAFDEQFIAAAYCIIVAAIFDGIDGKLARALGSTSSLGMELDSLCDAISFCLAPAIILYCWNLYVIEWVGLLAVGLYLCAGLFRLAKFNIINIEQKPFFIGLPTTVAASWVAALVIAFPWLEKSFWHFVIEPYRLVLIVGFIIFLMLSKVRFFSFKIRMLPLGTFIIIPIIISIAALYALVAHVPFCLTVVFSYIMSSLIYNLISPLSNVIRLRKFLDFLSH